MPGNAPRPWLLAADMDGTLIPLDQAPQRTQELAELRAALEEGEELILAYVTGRSLPLALDGIRRFHLPVPDYLACDVGTGVYRREGARFQPDPAYRDLMEEALGGLSTDVIRSALADIPGLRPQEDAQQGPYKISFYLDEPEGDSDPLRRLREILLQRSAHVSVVFSREPVSGVGLLDVLPAGVAKDTAVRFLHDRTGVDVERLVYAGDSGNDRAAMLAGYRVVVVGNAAASLKSELREGAADRGLLDRLYFAQAPYAAGVLEGLRHWGAA